MTTRCENFKGILLGVNSDTALIAYARCKMWTCAYCAERNRAHWRALILNSINQRPHIRWQFWTYTAHENATNSYECMINLQKGWTRLYGRVYRWAEKNLYNVYYVRVYEYHKNDRIHVHMIIGFEEMEGIHCCRQKFPFKTKWLKDNARKSGMGYECKVIEMENWNAGRITGYIAKYMTKMEKPLPKDTRRIQTDQEFIIKGYDYPGNDMHWSLMNDFSEDDFRILSDTGKEITDLAKKRKIEAIDFDLDGNYKPYED